MLRTSILSCLAGLVSTPSASAAAEGATQGALRVITYNIRYGGGNFEATIAAIKAVGPDPLALQDVGVQRGARSQRVDQAAVLAERLGRHVCDAPISRLPGVDPTASPREFGVARLNRYPVTSFSNRQLTRHSTQAERAPPAPAPGLLDATVDFHGASVRVRHTHLDDRPDPVVRSPKVREDSRCLARQRLRR